MGDLFLLIKTIFIQMVLIIVPILRSKIPGEAARLIGTSRNFITDVNLNDLLQNEYNLLDDTNDEMLEAEIQVYDTVPGIHEQVDAWLAS